eukprot:NODE_13816_length_251_cov_0.836634_g12903_i0.p2 GENE.NODE_13816_length_251_cov_0.836634_g12903_i0~~NODE_13816_length_251_cov_0.836634_g12903_i0.p2  ORF type:complete len:73 (-),score=12.71 NODE_13816_length_251_cov_0.836634_g12903_i0:22-240(-)
MDSTVRAMRGLRLESMLEILGLTLLSGVFSSTESGSADMVVVRIGRREEKVVVQGEEEEKAQRKKIRRAKKK